MRLLIARSRVRCPPEPLGLSLFSSFFLRLFSFRFFLGAFYILLDYTSISYQVRVTFIRLYFINTYILLVRIPGIYLFSFLRNQAACQRVHGVRSNGTKKKMCTCAQLAGKWYPVPGSAYLSTWYLVPGTWYDLRAHSIAYIVIFLFVWCTICSSPFRIQYVWHCTGESPSFAT